VRNRALLHWLKPAAALAVLGAVIWRVGAAPFVAGLRAAGWLPVAAALAITAVTTVAAAWRWRRIAAGLGLQLDLRTAVAAYYRSQFLNSVMPGGVVGDVERGLRHGETAVGLRSVLWDRVLGQWVTLAATAAVLFAVPSPVGRLGRLGWPMALGLLLTAAGVGAAARRSASGPVTGRRWSRAVAGLGVDVGAALRGGRAAIATGSLVVAAGHVGVFLIAASAAGAAATLPVAVLVLAAAAIPLNVAGWGPREGVAAWAYGAAGLGAAQGLAAATAYGVLALVATAPGALVLLADRRRPAAPPPIRPLTGSRV
jgi:glycosyltransferase 2 family protein